MCYGLLRQIISLALLFNFHMQPQTHPAGFSQPTQLHPKKQSSVVFHTNSFQKFLNVLSSDHAKKLEENAQSATVVLHGEEKNASQTLQNLKAQQPEVEHSRSRDKRKRVARTKSVKRPTKKGKQLPTDIHNELSDPIQQEISPAFSGTLAQLLKEQTTQPNNQLITVTEDYSGIITNLQYECGEIVETTIKADVALSGQPSPHQPSPLHKQRLMSENVSCQGWEQNANAPHLKQKEDDSGHKATPTEVIPFQEGAEVNKEKPNHQNFYPTQAESNERNERRGNFDDKDFIYKSRMCYDFLRGKCRRPANQCSYAHGYIDVKPDKRAKFVCRNYTKGFCKKPQEECVFFHDKPRERDYSPGSERNSSLSDEQKRKSGKAEVASNRDGKKYEKRESKHAQRSSEERKDQRRDQRRQERREQRKQDRRQQRKEEKKENKRDDRKQLKRSEERPTEKKYEKASERREEHKKYTENYENSHGYEASPSYWNPYPSFSFVSGYYDPNQYPAQPIPHNGHNRSQQMSSATQNNMNCYHPPFCTPIYFSTFYPMPQRNPYVAPQMNNSSMNYQQQNRTNLPNFHSHSTPLPQNFPIHGQSCWFPPFHPFGVPQTQPSQHSNPNNVSNDSITPPNSDCEYPLNNSTQDRRQRQKHGNRQHKRASSKQRLKERKEKKHHRR